MDAKRKSINLNLEEYKEEGLYLIFPDSTRLALTKKNIENTAEEFWNDPARITPEIRKAVEMERCAFCPLKGKKDICNAIRPVLPLIKDLDKYASFDSVIAIYKEKGVLHIADTTMHEALRYLSILSLLAYGQIGRKYWKYYYGIMPLMGAREVATRVFLNIYWLHKGNRQEIDSVISRFIEEVRITSQNQVKRLNLICKRDAFMNAFVNTQIATEFLSMDIEKSLQKQFDEFDKEKSF